MPLTDVICKNSKPAEKARKLADSGGLYLEVMPTGSKYWRMKYRYVGKEKRLAIGVYPEVSLKEAREKRDQARKLLADGIDPSQAKQEAKEQKARSIEDSFEAIAREWYSKRQSKWKATYAAKLLRRVEVDLFPALGHRPIAEIKAPELLKVLREIEARGANDIAKRALQNSGMIFRYAIATGRAERDLSADLRGALETVKVTHHAHLSSSEIPQFINRLAAYDGDMQTRLAIELVLLTFTRTIEVRGAKWQEINFDKAEWRIPAERMKMGVEHIVPLSKQALAVLRQVQEITRTSEYIFPNQNNTRRHMSENTMLFALYRMGYHKKLTIHGLRGTASTALNEMGFDRDVIERQLAHNERNQARAAYNHAQYLPQRQTMMQQWADYLHEAGQKGNNVVAGKFANASSKAQHG